VTDNPRLEYALHYAGKGWPVLPLWWPVGDACACRLGKDCGSKGKHPLHELAPNGSKDATTNVLKITQWWTKHPLANVGIATGGGRMVVDVDAYKGGAVGLDELEAKWGKLPTSLRAASGSGNGSQHIHLALPAGAEVRNSAGVKLGQGLDVRGIGGYVVAPPSLHVSGGTYSWLDEDETDLELAPDWLVRLCQTPKVEEGAVGLDPDDVLSEAASERVAGWLLPKAGVKVDAGMSRHDAWVWFVTQCSDNRVPLEVAKSYRDMWLGICRETGRDRKLAYGELDRALTWAYRPEGPRRPPLDAVLDLLIREEEERTGVKSPEVVFSSKPPERAHAVVSTAHGDVLGIVKEAWMGFDEALDRQGDISHRYKTGFKTLDEFLGGGLPRGRVMVAVGSPGAGKTTLALQVVINIATTEDVVVGVLLQDEGLGAGAVRLAQRYGHSRASIEAADAAVFAAAKADLAKLKNVYCLDPDHQAATLEHLFRGMIEFAQGKPIILLVDSAQVVRMEQQLEGKASSDMRLKTKLAVEYFKAECRRNGITGFLLSQSNRSSYRSKKDGDNSDPLSAGAETAALEFMADVMVWLSPDGQDRTKMTIPKSRVGLGPSSIPIYYELDRTRALYTEVSPESVDAEQASHSKAKEEAQIALKRSPILDALALVGEDGMSTYAICKEVTGKQSILQAALEQLKLDGLIDRRKPSGKRPGAGLVWVLRGV